MDEDEDEETSVNDSCFEEKKKKIQATPGLLSLKK